MATPAKLCVFAVIFGFFQLVSGIIYVDNILCEPNKAVLDMTVVTAHDATGNALTNLTFKTRSVVTKMLLYLKVIMADDQIKAGVTREVLRSVVDIEKVMKGSHSNPLIKQFFDSLLPKMNFTMSFPFQPVSAETLQTFHSNQINIVSRVPM